ncbi:MAG: zinc ribbon domain-containing protein [Blastocatellia bacterium]|nr:zinc ribbon domain-containing protein [Blastocatellia bacterium]
MRRASRVTLKFATNLKRKHIAALLEAYRAAVNFYIRILWNEGGSLNKETLAKLEHTRLSERYKSQALKQAIEIVNSTRKSAQALGREPSQPIFKGSAVLDAKFVSIEEGRASFDLVIRLSCLNIGHKIIIPTRRTTHLNKLLSQPGAVLVQGCALSENGIILWVELPDLPFKREGRVLAIDIGVNKLISDSEGNHYGKEFKKIRDKINRRKPGSKGRQRAFRERENFINRCLNQLPWAFIYALGVEALHDMKRGKKKGRGKKFRKAIAPWTYRRVLERAGQKAEQNRVLFVAVPAAYTSQECPDCGWCDKENRKGENFRCTHCARTGDADTIGAMNVLARTLETLGSVESPRL